MAAIKALPLGHERPRAVFSLCLSSLQETGRNQYSPLRYSGNLDATASHPASLDKMRVSVATSLVMGIALSLIAPSQALPFRFWKRFSTDNLRPRAPKESIIVVPIYGTDTIATPQTQTQVVTNIIPTTITAPGPTATLTESVPTVTEEKTNTVVVISTVDIHGPMPPTSNIRGPPAATTPPTASSYAMLTPALPAPTAGASSAKTYDNGLWKTSYPPWTGQMKRHATMTHELRV
jgi:hypothetical protein